LNAFAFRHLKGNIAFVAAMAAMLDAQGRIRQRNKTSAGA